MMAKPSKLTWLGALLDWRVRATYVLFSQTSRVSYGGISLLLCICECVQLLMLHHLTYVYCMYHTGMYVHTTHKIHTYSRLLTLQAPSDLLLVDNT